MEDVIFADGALYKKSEDMDPMEYAAKLFAQANSSDQALFFTCLAKEVENYARHPGFQWGYLSEDMGANARAIFKDMAEHILEEK